MLKKPKSSKENLAGEKARAMIDRRIYKEKSQFIAHLKKNHGLSIACQNVGIESRTYYRWRQEDSTFAEQADNAIRDAIALRNDLVASKLLVGIQQGDVRAIQFCFRHRHLDYDAKVKIERQLADSSDLTQDQEEKQIR